VVAAAAADLEWKLQSQLEFAKEQVAALKRQLLLDE
jgi:hypothetical protein